MTSIKVAPKVSKALLAVATTLAGCAIGPDYEVPESKLPKAFDEGESNKKANEAELRAWWCHFDDATLTLLIEKSLDGSLDLRAALARVNQGRALARQAFSELLPGSQLSGVQEKARVSGARFPGAGAFEYKVYTGSIDATWEIDFFGRLRRELESRNASHAALVADLADSMRILTAEVAMAYLDYNSNHWT
jgi:outer membrane protein, multidrug efflux system